MGKPSHIKGIEEMILCHLFGNAEIAFIDIEVGI